MGHPQHPTPIQVDNTTAMAFTNKTIKRKKSKVIDMCVYWLQDRCNLGKFITHWAPVGDNTADYHTTHHPPFHHKKMRTSIIHTTGIF